VRFLVDHNLSPVVAQHLRDAGHDAVHTGDVDLATAEDIEILLVARKEARVIISADTDFGTLLASQRTDDPSLLLIRLRSPRRAVELADLLLANLDTVAADLASGAIVVVEDERLRIRRLPI